MEKNRIWQTDFRYQESPVCDRKIKGELSVWSRRKIFYTADRTLNLKSNLQTIEEYGRIVTAGILPCGAFIYENGGAP